MAGQQQIPEDPPEPGKQNDTSSNSLNWKRGQEITANKLNETVKAVRKNQEGVRNARQLTPKVGAGSSVEAIHFEQQSDDQADMPANGNDFAPTNLVDRTVQFYRFFGFFNAGTFNVQLKIGGVLVGPIITQATAGLNNGIDLSPLIIYENNANITLHVNTSAASEFFRLMFLFRGIN